MVLLYEDLLYSHLHHFELLSLLLRLVNHSLKRYVGLAQMLGKVVIPFELVLGALLLYVLQLGHLVDATGKALGVLVLQSHMETVFEACNEAFVWRSLVKGHQEDLL